LTGLQKTLEGDARCQEWKTVAILLTDGAPGDGARAYTSMAVMLKQRFEVEFQLISFGTEATARLGALAKALDCPLHTPRFMEAEVAKTLKALSTRCSTLRGDVSLVPRTNAKREEENAWQSMTGEEPKRDAWIVLRNGQGEWVLHQPEPSKVRLHRAHFAEGGLRYVRHSFVPSTGKGERHLVVKESKFEEQPDGLRGVDAVQKLFLDAHDAAKKMSGKYTEEKKKAFTRVAARLGNVYLDELRILDIYIYVCSCVFIYIYIYIYIHIYTCVCV